MLLRELRNRLPVVHISSRQAWRARTEQEAEFRRLSTRARLPGFRPEYLRQLGAIGTLIDVGVLEGTPSLYAAFPDAYLVLVEALPDFQPACHQILQTRAGEVHGCAASDEDGEVEFRYYPDRPATSSVVATHLPNKKRLKRLTVPMSRLDTLLQGRDLPGNWLLKVDVEGLEHRVVRGAEGILPRVKYCITETSIRKRHEDSYRFADLIALMRSYGFDLYDVLTVTRRRVDAPRASIMDAVFINSAMDAEPGR